MSDLPTNFAPVGRFLLDATISAHFDGCSLYKGPVSVILMSVLMWLQVYQTCWRSTNTTSQFQFQTTATLSRWGDQQASHDARQKLVTFNIKEMWGESGRAWTQTKASAPANRSRWSSDEMGFTVFSQWRTVGHDYRRGPSTLQWWKGFSFLFL